MAPDADGDRDVLSSQGFIKGSPASGATGDCIKGSSSALPGRAGDGAAAVAVCASGSIEVREVVSPIFRRPLLPLPAFLFLFLLETKRRDFVFESKSEIKTD